MPGGPAGVLVRLNRIERRVSSVSLAAPYGGTAADRPVFAPWQCADRRVSGTGVITGGSLWS